MGVLLSVSLLRARNPRASALSFNSLEAMSALLCCGPVFHNKGLERESNLYRWLDNMLTSGEQRVGGAAERAEDGWGC